MLTVEEYLHQNLISKALTLRKTANFEKHLQNLCLRKLKYFKIGKLMQLIFSNEPEDHYK